MTTEHTRPLPAPTPETAPFWEGCKRGELRIQRCNDCEQYYFYPRPYCPHCLSDDTEWHTVSGQATLATYVINHRPPPAFKGEAPLITAMVRLAEGPHLMTNIIGVEPDPAQLPVGLPVSVVFEDVGDTIAVPKFRPSEGA